MGLPLVDWDIYCEPTHALLYTPPDSPDMPRVLAASLASAARMAESVAETRRSPRPGMVNAVDRGVHLRGTGNRRGHPRRHVPAHRRGFDTTTALTAHSLEWLSEHRVDRDRLRADLPGLIDSATEELARVRPGARRRSDGDVATTSCRANSWQRVIAFTSRLRWPIAIHRSLPILTPSS